MVLLKLAVLVLGILGILLGMTPLLDRYRRATLRRILKDVAGVMNSRGIDYWADFGTLLGLVREGDLILGDKDVDLCVLEEARPKVMAAAEDFTARGYWLTGEGGAARKLMRLFDLRTPFYADIYPYRAEGDTLRSVLDPRDDAPAALVLEKRPHSFLGTSVSVPTNAEGLLEYRYGPTYRTPRRNDKGRAGGSGLWHSVLQDLEASSLFVWFLLRYAVGVRPRRG